MKDETAKALHEEMLNRAKQSRDCASLYSVQFVKSNNPEDKATALRYMAEEALWTTAAGLIHQARAHG